MKMLLLTAMFVMLFYRIKNTYQSISKKKWESELKDNIEILKKFKEEKQSEWKIYLLTFFVVALILYFLYALVYILVPFELKNEYILILSSLQLITVLYNVKELFLMKTTFDIKDYKFNRIWNLFNVILDYVYYVVVIVMLLM